MQRGTGILLGIILGAVAAGLGVGVFLHKANQDRIRLAEQTRTTVEEAARITEENRRAIEEANQKLELAKTQVIKTQEALRALQEERDFLARAIPLLPPAPRDIYGWKELVALHQGFTVKVPPRSTSSANDKTAFSLTSEDQTSGRFPWLFVSPYNQQQEQDLVKSLTTSTSVVYLVHDHLLSGVRGVPHGQNSPVYILRIQKDGKTSHLLWTQPSSVARLGEKTVLTLLSTLRFQ